MNRCRLNRGADRANARRFSRRGRVGCRLIIFHHRSAGRKCSDRTDGEQSEDQFSFHSEKVVNDWFSIVRIVSPLCDARIRQGENNQCRFNRDILRYWESFSCFFFPWPSPCASGPAALCVPPPFAACALPPSVVSLGLCSG